MTFCLYLVGRNVVSRTQTILSSLPTHCSRHCRPVTTLEDVFVSYEVRCKWRRCYTANERQLICRLSRSHVDLRKKPACQELTSWSTATTGALSTRHIRPSFDQHCRTTWGNSDYMNVTTVDTMSDNDIRKRVTRGVVSENSFQLISVYFRYVRLYLDNLFTVNRFSELMVIAYSIRFISDSKVHRTNQWKNMQQMSNLCCLAG